MAGTALAAPAAAALTLTWPGMDDCDAATLIGVLREALAAHPRGADMLAGRELTCTTTPVYADAPYVSVLTFPAGA